MSGGGPTPFTAAGVPSDEFAALLEKGRNVGFLTPDDLMTVLERVELSEELLDAVRGRVQAEGIALVDEDEPVEESRSHHAVQQAVEEAVREAEKALAVSTITAEREMAAGAGSAATVTMRP